MEQYGATSCKLRRLFRKLFACCPTSLHVACIADFELPYIAGFGKYMAIFASHFTVVRAAGSVVARVVCCVQCKMASCSWNNDKIINFIDAVHLRPCLWDNKNSEYKNRNLKKDEWMAIGIEFEIPSEEAIKKFKNLRTYFNNEIKKQQKKQKSGSGAYQDSTWFAFKSMSFLKGIDEADPGKDSETQSEKNGESDDETTKSSPKLPPPLPPPPLSSRSKKEKTREDKQYETACEVMEEVRKK